MRVQALTFDWQDAAEVSPDERRAVEGAAALKPDAGFDVAALNDSVGSLRQALRACHRKGAKAAGADLREHSGGIVEHAAGLPADGRGNSLCRALVRHVPDTDAGHALEHLHAKMPGGSVSG